MTPHDCIKRYANAMGRIAQSEPYAASVILGQHHGRNKPVVFGDDIDRFTDRLVRREQPATIIQCLLIEPLVLWT